jgi:hypothetical protein
MGRRARLAEAVTRGPIDVTAGVLHDAANEERDACVEGGEDVGRNEFVTLEAARVAAQERRIGATDEPENGTLDGAQLAVLEEPK